MYFGLNSNLNSNFFSSMLGTGSTGSTGSLYSSLADYAAIKNGSYGKLVKAYYAQQSGETTSANKKKDTVKTKTDVDNDKKKLTETKTKADAVMKSADALMERGSKSLFNKVDVKDEETGETTKQYDTDKIYKAVKQFASDYNALVSNVSKSTNSSVLRKGITMTGDMKAKEDALNDIGITINSDNTLSVDEKKFKEANMLDVKSMFNGALSISGKAYQKANEINNLSSSAASANSLYNSSAAYVNSYSGTFYNGSF